MQVWEIVMFGKNILVAANLVTNLEEVYTMYHTHIYVRMRMHV